MPSKFLMRLFAGVIANKHIFKLSIEVLITLIKYYKIDRVLNNLIQLIQKNENGCHICAKKKVNIGKRYCSQYLLKDRKGTYNIDHFLCILL